MGISGDAIMVACVIFAIIELELNFVLQTEPVSEQQMFAELYNDIVLNSPAIHTILGVEHSYSIALREAQERKMREVADRTESCMLKLEQVKENAENNGEGLIHLSIVG